MGIYFDGIYYETTVMMNRKLQVKIIQKQKKTNKTKIDIDSSNEEQEIIKLEIEERKMKLAERQTIDRKA
uniref:Uncharacterized protein n=2 Tax=Rhizophagus irregularis TaxID=588596 RepID=U9SXA0_RHIID